MNKTCDVLIVGSGLAGLYAALLLDPSLKVIVLTKDRMKESNSYLAQGGIAAVIDKKHDKQENHVNDTLRAGAGICNLQALHVLVDEAVQNICNLQRMGVSFDQENGKLSLTREGGHGRARILHIDGDATGKGLMDVLIRNAQSRPNIKIIEYSICVDILMSNNRCIGVLALKQDKLNYYFARSVILAAGGIGMIYGITTNACTLTGDAIAMAERAGAEIKDMEFIQFHPTVFYSKENKRFLISEAVRGEGAVLKNVHGERFMHKYDQRQELAPRDVVSRAIISEMDKTQAEHVFLDLTHLNRAYIFKRFPNITAKCREYGIDISTAMIPVSPAQHYLMGGIKTDLWARTSIPGLYACGETACTGVHGANRLASNSLLEALVFANRASKMITASIENIKDFSQSKEQRTEMLPPSNYDVSSEREEIQVSMRKYAGIIRSVEGLNNCCKVLNEIENSLQKKKCLNKEFIECFNMLTTAKLIIRQALKREKSIGAHYLREEKGMLRA
ncbi:MAG: L-aspartate oxidase [Bacillota bacterium]